jgi:CDP-diacylglycerol---glycerol-3-phosphate 3-phosphatidyltransferase
VNWDEYASAWAGLHGGYDPRRASVAVRGWLWLAYAIGRLLTRLGASPTGVTGAGLVLAIAVPLVAAQGPAWAIAAAGLVLLGAMADSADGAVALIGGRVTRLGYVYDSLADRVGELCWGAALWAVGVPWQLPAACVAMSWLHEYARARATAAGMTGIGAVTAAERPTRVSVSLIGLLLAGATGLVAPEFAAGTATVVTAVWALLAAIGLSQLMGAIRLALR